MTVVSSLEHPFQALHIHQMSNAQNPKLIVVVNSLGRQAASLVRVASAVGYKVRAQLRGLEGVVAQELQGLRNVELVVGSLEDPNLILNLFTGAQLAFINTTLYGDEVAIGKSLADAAKRAGIQHYVYSTMPDHSIYGQGWPGLPHWSTKFAVENYVRSLGIPATFVYTGIYNNNFTSLPYPLFQLELQHDNSFVWKAPFSAKVKLPFLDAEHDIGPAVLQIFKDGPRKWEKQRCVSNIFKLIFHRNLFLPLETIPREEVF
jgi:NmrA-like family